MTTDQGRARFGAGFHAPPGKAVDSSAYDRWTGRWSRLFIPAVLAAAAVQPGCRVLDVSTGTGEAARMALPLVGIGGLVVGADISPAMLASARTRLQGSRFLPVAADGQALPLRDGSFDAVVSFRMLMHTPEWERCVAELCRVAVRLVIVDYPSATSVALFESLARRGMHAAGMTTEPYRVFTRSAIANRFVSPASRASARATFLITSLRGSARV